jgi:hypothetical protein
MATSLGFQPRSVAAECQGGPEGLSVLEIQVGRPGLDPGALGLKVTFNLLRDVGLDAGRFVFKKKCWRASVWSRDVGEI